MHRTYNLLPAAALAVSLLAACGGGDDDTVVPAGPAVESLFATATEIPAETPAPPVDGPAVLEDLTGRLRVEVPEAVVEDGTTNLTSRWARSVWLRTVGGVTDGQVRLDVYAAPTDRDRWVGEFRASAEPGAYLIVGESWTATAFNADDAATARRLLGGELVTAGA